MSAAAERGLFAAKGHARAAGASPAPRDDATRPDAAAPRVAAEEAAQPALPLADIERPQGDEHQPGSLLTFRLRSAPGSTALTDEIVAALARREPEPSATAAPADAASAGTPSSDAAEDPIAKPAARAETAPTPIAAAAAPAPVAAGPAIVETAPGSSGGRIDRPLFPPVRPTPKPSEPASSVPPRLSPLRTVVPVAAAVAAIAVVGWLVTQTGAPPSEPVPAPIEEATGAAIPTAPAADTGNGNPGNGPALAPATEAATAPETPPAPVAAAPATATPAPATQTMAASLVAPEPPQPVAPDPDPVVGLPSLDLVRAEPGAPPVIAGRALPGSRLIVLDNGMPLGEATADANGEWAMVGDAPLPAGRHELTLALETPEGALVIEQADAELAPAGDQAGLPIPGQKPLAGAVAQGYVVQLASVPSAADAEREWERLQSAYPRLLGEREATVDEADIGERGTFFRLRTGPFADRGEARALCGALNGAGQDCLVIRGVETD